jgi:hypothetical protein
MRYAVWFAWSGAGRGFARVAAVLLFAGTGATARAEVPRYREVSFMLANEGLDHHGEGGNLGDFEQIPLRWQGNEFTLEDRHPPDNPHFMHHETRMKGRISADDERIETLEIDDVFLYEHLDGRPMQARLQVKAKNLPLRRGRVAGDLESERPAARPVAAARPARGVRSGNGGHT